MAIGFAMRLAKLSGGVHEHKDDYLDALMPVMTDDMGDFGKRYSGTYRELMEVVIKTAGKELDSESAAQIVQLTKLLQVQINNTNSSHCVATPWSQPAVTALDSWKVQGGTPDAPSRFMS